MITGHLKRFGDQNKPGENKEIDRHRDNEERRKV